MSAVPSQAFRTQSSSRIVTIPTRNDPKSNQRVILLKDIQLSFEHVKRIMRGGEAVLFLADEDFEYLIPPRIAHQPGVVLDVITTDDNQDDPSSMGIASSNTHVVGELSALAGSSNEAMSMARGMASLRIRGADGNNQHLIVDPRELMSENGLQPMPTSTSNPLPLGTESSMAQPENPHPFQQQMKELVERIQQTDQKMEEVLARIQQTDQQREHTQQQTQGQFSQILQNLQQMNRQHIEEVERITQQLNLHRQQWEESLQTSQQQQQQRIETVQQKLQQLDQDSRQQIRGILQQTQRQIDKSLNDVQQLGQNAQHLQQQHEITLQQMSGMGNTRQNQDRLSPKLGRQEEQYAFNQFVHAQYRVQSVLARLSPKTPIPRLFIILPALTAAVDEQLGSCPLQFRLYFLCECGSHTTAKNCNTPREVHLANHPGYDLNNQDELIIKYGSYLLTMMYMVKHGAKARGLVVPPLLGLNHATGGGQNIGQLVDDTISHLKEATGCIDGETTVHPCLDTMELTELKWHLKAKDGEGFSGDLSQIKIQRTHYAWICSDHLREYLYYESTLQQLEFNTNASGGVWHGNEVWVKITPDAMTLLLYNLGTIFRIQNVEYWRCITGIDLKLNGQQSVSSPTTDILSGLDDLESLSLDFGRLTLSVKGIFRSDIQDVTISIENLRTLTLDDLEFIEQCRPNALVILQTPQQMDDNRLVSLLLHNSRITNLRTVCDVKRHIAIIDLVSSTREKMLQNGDCPALRKFELVHPGTKTEVSFDEESPALGTAPCINLGSCQSYIVEPAVYNTIRQHGWSAITFVAPGLFSDRLAILLDECMQETDSRIARLDITPTSLTTQGLDALSRVIHQSLGLTYLRLSLESLEQKHQLEKALLLLERHKDRLTSLRLNGQNVQVWLLRIAATFPDPDRFPALEEFLVGDRWSSWMSELECQWIASMVSTRQQSQTSLKVFGVTDTSFIDHDLEPVILAVDLSTIEELHFKGLCEPQGLNLLADRIMDSGVSSLPLRLLDFKGTTLSSDTTREMFARVQEKAPQVEVRWE